MLFEESRHSHKLIGRLEQGEDVVDAITALSKAGEIRAAELRGVGTLRDVELVRFDPDARAYETVLSGEGVFDIVQMSGNVSILGDEVVVRVEALLAAMGPAGQQLVFGQVRSAEVVDCEFVLDVFEDLVVERRLDPKTGLLRWESVRQVETAAAQVPTPEARPASRPAAEAPAAAAAAAPREPARETAREEAEGQRLVTKKASWDEAIEASDQIRPASQREEKKPLRNAPEEPSAEEVYGDYDFNAPILSAGDILDHPKLGRCRVIRVEDDDYAHIRLSRGQIRKLSLEVCDIVYVGKEGDRNLFQVKVRR